MSELEKDIVKIIDKFAERGLVFSNEQDFQFEIALALKEKKYLVKLEAVSLTNDWKDVLGNVSKGINLTKKDKEYSDILVKKSNEKYAVIELKYKTPNRVCCYTNQKGDKMITLRQGAYNHGTYYYLEDVRRLENIKKRFMQSDIQSKIDECFAILLTNDYSYQKRHSGTWEKYALIDGQTIPNKDFHFVGTANPKIYGKFTAIELNESYKIKWRHYRIHDVNNQEYDYEGKKNKQSPGFSYLVIRVIPN